MNKIIGAESIVKRIDSARPGDPVVYVNLDFLESLPDAFEARAVEVPFTKEESFTNVGSEKSPSWYPGTKLMYDVAEARGISCDDVNGLIPYYTEVDLSRMEMTPNPVIIRKQTGYQATKSGSVQQEDGSKRTITRDHIEDAWIECTGLWDKEELASEGYTKTVKDNWGNLGYNYTWNKETKFAAYKYDTKYKRRVHFNDLLDKAMGKADTKCKCKVIRELACLKTGYTNDDLKEGRFIFAKIVKSNNQIKMEAAARVNALSHGNADTTASRALFAPSAPTVPVEPTRNVTPPPVATPAPTVADLAHSAAETPPAVKEVAAAVVDSARTGEPFHAPDQRAELIRVLEKYTELKLVPTASAVVCGKILTWLNSTPKATEDATYWPKAIGVLAAIEADIADPMRISQGIRR